MFPKTHFQLSVRTNSHNERNKKSQVHNIPLEYNINDEIATLTHHLIQTRRLRLLPHITVPITNGSSKWPSNLPTFVISIDPIRRQNFMNRFRHTSTLFEGTNGKTIDVTQWRREKRLFSNVLKRGEIGCYDSHLRLWKMLVKYEIPMALICEDDVDLTGNSMQSQYLNTLLTEIKQTPFDVLYLSWFRPIGGKYNTEHTRVQWCFCQHWAYIVTLSGVKKLLADPHIERMNLPVDVAVWNAHCRGVVRNIVAYPPLTLTVGERSDTRNIR